MPPSPICSISLYGPMTVPTASESLGDSTVSVVGAGYGLGYRNLGAVGVVGPLRLDYAKAIDSVRDAAGELSRLFATVYEG